MKVNIEIDTRTFVRFWLVVIGFALAGLAVYSARTAILIVGIAFFIAIALNPPVNKMVKLFPGKSRVAGTAVAYLGIVLIISAIIFFVIPPIVNQTVKFAQNVPELINSASSQYSAVDGLIDEYSLRPQVDEALNSIKSSATQFASDAGSLLITGIGSVLSIIVSGILVLVLAFLILIEGPSWLKTLWNAYDDTELMESHRNVLTRMHNVFNSYIIGQLSIAALAGVISGLAVFIGGLIFNSTNDMTIPTVFIMFIASLIPIFGPITGMTLVALVLAISNPYYALIFVIFSVIYQQIEGNYIYPKVQSKRINLSPLAILVSLTIGLYVFGFVGGLISIPIAGCVGILVEDYFTRVKKKRIENDKPLSRLIKKIQEKS